MIENEIYKFLEIYDKNPNDYSYNRIVINEICDYLTHVLRIDYRIHCEVFPDMEEGLCAIAFIEDSKPKLITFYYKY